MVSKEEFKRSLELRFESVKKHNLSINEAVKMCMLDFEDKDFFTKQEIFESLKRAMDIEQSKQSVKQKVK